MKKEVMFLFGTGYKGLVIARFIKEKEFTHSSSFIIDETIIQIGSQHFWLWICIEPIDKSVLGIQFQKKET
jgi:transposase-like protein